MFVVELSCGCRPGEGGASCARSWWLTAADAVEPRGFTSRWEAYVAGQGEVLRGSTHAHEWSYAVVELPSAAGARDLALVVNDSDRAHR